MASPAAQTPHEQDVASEEEPSNETRQGLKQAEAENELLSSELKSDSILNIKREEDTSQSKTHADEKTIELRSPRGNRNLESIGESGNTSHRLQ